MKASSILIFLLIIVANLIGWSYFNRPQEAQAWLGTIKGISFSPLREHHNPEKGIFPHREEIAEDLNLLQGKVRAVRIYSVLNGQEAIPELAWDRKLYVTAGAWIGQDQEANLLEVSSLIELSNTYPNIVRNLVGNEVLLRQDLSINQLIEHIRRVRKRVSQPVSTSEPWHVWLAHPELAEEVDFIAAHILPYWEGLPVDKAVDFVFDRYQVLQKTFPDKPVIITEVGWPGGGQPIGQAEATRVNQARFLREFFNRAYREKIIYYTVEAFDQPWKRTIEGSSGAHWGIYNADRKVKFSMLNNVEAFPEWQAWALLAGVLAFAVMRLSLKQRVKLLQVPGKVLITGLACIAASTLVWSLFMGVSQYHTWTTVVFWGVLLLMQVAALWILLIEGREIAEVIWSQHSDRNFKPISATSDFPFPKVSLHVPIHNEPPEMVRETLDALAKLDYPDYEVLVIDNNTTDTRIWRPVQAFCAQLGAQFRFFHLADWPGYKAGALNYALEQTAHNVDIIAVIDSDYIVEPNWLKSMVPHFERPEVGFVQSPQDYRDWKENTFKRACYWEYAGFFNIGMVLRNRFNAIIQHGTMTLVRRSALEKTGRWGEWCICEDSELGLRLYRYGYDSVYVNQSFGRGLMPATLAAYKTQRFRWVYGAMQIIKGHLGALFTGQKSDLTAAQRYYFIAGWVPWFADAFALILTLASLILSALVLADPLHSELPVIAFILPTLGLFCFKILRAIWLYTARVKCSFWQTLGATLSGLALTHTVAKAILLGFITSGRPFVRTPKCEGTRPFSSVFRMVREEMGLLVLLLGAAATFAWMQHFDNMIGHLWVAVLLVQAVPYAAAVITAIINVLPAVRLSVNRETKKISAKQLKDA